MWFVNNLIVELSDLVEGQFNFMYDMQRVIYYF